MSLYAVIREAGPAWTVGKGVFEQVGIEGHAAFMNALGTEGFIQFGGPLAGSEGGRIKVLLIADAVSESDIRRRLADDPWAVSQHLVVTSVESWNLLVGAERLASSAS